MIKKLIPYGILAGAVLALSFSDNPYRKEKKDGEVHWVTFEEGIERSRMENKKIFIDVYTDWCGYCKIMDKQTFGDPDIAAYINEHFIPVKFNAEQRESIEFKDHTFSFVSSGSRGYHELAAYLMNNKLSYPTTVFLDEKQNLIFPVPGYQKPTDFDRILHYVEGEYYKTIAWKEFVREYSKS